MLKPTNIKKIFEQIKKDEVKSPHWSSADPDDFYKELIDSRRKFLLLSGRPAMGKTALVLNIINYALLEGKKVDVYTGSSSKERLVMRLASIRTGIPILDLDRNGMKKYATEYKEAFDSLAKSDIRFYEGRIVTENDVINNIKKSNARDLVCVLDIDRILPGVFDRCATHEEMMKYEVEDMAVDPDNHLVENIVRAIKELAKEKGFTALGTITHSRIADYRSCHYPRLEDLRKFGKLEEVPDMVGLLFRDLYSFWDNYDEEEEEESNSRASLEIYYNTDDFQMKYIKVAWDEDTASFISYDEWMRREYLDEDYDYQDPGSFDIDENVPF